MEKAKKVLSCVLCIMLLLGSNPVAAYASHSSKHHRSERGHSKVYVEKASKGNSKSGSKSGASKTNYSGTTDSSNSGTSEGTNSGTTDSTNPGTSEGTNSGTTDSTNPGTSEGTNSGTTDSTNPGTSEETSGTTEGSTSGTTEGATEETTEDTPEVVVEQPPEVIVEELEDTVSLIAPPNGLTPAKGDGTDETEIIQEIFDYATAAHKTILIPSGYTFVVDHILIYKEDNFTIKGSGVLKHRDGATKALLSISVCNDFTIEELNTDGNVEGNETERGGRLDESQDLHSVEIVWSHDFTVGRITDINPAADSLYLNDVSDGTIGTLIATADEPCGRNGLSIIKAENLTFNRVEVQNIGVEGMPSGIDFEPNNSSDDIRNIVIKSAKVETAYGAGIAATSQYGSEIEDIEINGQITKYGHGSYSFMLDNVKNFKGNIKIYQEGQDRSYGARISRCDTVNANLEIYNVGNGIDLGVGSTNIHLTGKIIGATGDGISIWNGLANSTIDMEIKQAGQDGEHGVIQISEYGSVDNIVFKGDYSYSGTGAYCFLVDGVATNCRTENLDASGWNTKSFIRGDLAKTVAFSSSTR